MTNSKKQEQLLTCDKQNFCWIKCTKLNNKILKLNIVAVVQKSFEVGWREKAVNLKSTYSIVKQIQFEVKHLFTITKTFREAVTGNNESIQALFVWEAFQSTKRFYFL